MTSDSASRSYDVIPDFGALYDALPAYALRGDVAFYLDEARRAEGPILELGCGTGRILLPIAESGLVVTGVDGSANMLARFREKLALSDIETQSRVTLVQADACALALAQQFALITAPFRVFQQLVTVEEQLQFLETVARHLTPNGRFVFDLFNPNFAALVLDRTHETMDTHEQPLPDGRLLSRAFRVAEVRWLDQVSETELVYYLRKEGDSSAQRHVQQFGMRWSLYSELVHLLHRCGLEITESFGNFDRSPLVDGAPEMVICAKLR